MPDLTTTTAELLLKSILNTSANPANRSDGSIKSRSVAYIDPYWHTFPPVSKEAHYVVGCSLAVIGIVGGIGNGLVVWTFAYNKRLRTPANTLIMNLALSDFLNAFLFPMSCFSSFARHWTFGKIGCDLYAGGTGLFGLMSIVTMTAISYERYQVICVKPMTASLKLTHSRTIKIIGISWLYCLALIMPPFFGWGRYSAEGFLVSCSFDYLDRTSSNRTFILYLFTFGFVVPVACIVFCYSFMLFVIHAHEREIHAASTSQDGLRRERSSRGTKRRRRPHDSNNGVIRVDVKIAKVVFIIICLFMLSWTPYALVTLIAQFGDASLVTPWMSTMPALFAKASIVYNPIVYAISHPQFRKEIRMCLFTCPRIGTQRPTSDQHKYGSRKTTANSDTWKAATPASAVPDQSSRSDGKDLSNDPAVAENPVV